MRINRFAKVVDSESGSTAAVILSKPVKRMAKPIATLPAISDLFDFRIMITKMPMIAAIGAASAFVESALGQAYKVKNPDGEFSGGPAYYIEKGLKCKPYAILFAIVAFLGPGFLMPGVQINSLVTVFEEAFSVNKILVGAICCVILGIVVYGSIKRIAQIAELLAPAMCAVS